MKNNFQNKIYNYEVIPPENSWGKIADVLDHAEQKKNFSSKLYHLEVTPSVLAWEKIKKSLPVTSGAETQKKTKTSPFFQYAAAAVIIGLIIWGSSIFLDSNKSKKVIAKENAVFQTTDSTISAKKGAVGTIDNSTASEQARDDAALEASKHILAKVDLPGINRLSEYRTVPAEMIRLAADKNSGLAINYHDAIMASSFPYAETNNNIADRYILLMTPDGNIIRMSKKWADLVCCISGAEQDEGCKDQLQRWREQVACSASALSPGNFIDILSLISSLKDY
ncbi:MAG TPA: hypothetical protein VET23_14580 [Chitinophagaceae bacterium]|nr:hypothetical protein [Chitinophagaceae bacterium]